MRGKAPQGLPHGADFRITPAYAGKRLVCVRLAVLPQDHPRLCGEKPRAEPVPAAVEGSPPPMRGKGISPYSLCARRQDHPRLCGEKFAAPLRRF